jgi:hypothetical protein
LLRKPKLSAGEYRILCILQNKRSKRRARRIARMEAHARAAIAEGREVDWSAVDWSAILKQILEVLVKLLPLILAI